MPPETQFNMIVSNKRKDVSTLTVVMQKKKGKTNVASVAHYNIPYVERPWKERPAIKRKNGNKKHSSCRRRHQKGRQSFFSRYWYDLLLCKKVAVKFKKLIKVNKG